MIQPRLCAGRPLWAFVLVLGLLSMAPLGAQEPQKAEQKRELEPKVEVILGPGTVVFIAAILDSEEDADQEMLPVRYDARFTKNRVRCAENAARGCLETRLQAIGFPMTYASEESDCEEPMAIEGVRFDGRDLPPTEPPRGSRHKRRTAWFAAGFSVENGATVLAFYRCPQDAAAAAVDGETVPAAPPGESSP
jgi:hypothetical protein